MSYRGRGYQKVPKPYGTEEWKSFLNFAKTHYVSMVTLSTEVTLEKCGSMSTLTPLGKTILSALLDKTLSPLVYVWEEWQLLTSEKRLPYATPEYAKQLEANIKQAKEALAKAEAMGFGKKES